MSSLTRFEIEGGGTVLVESPDDQGITRATGRPEAVRNAAETYQAALSGVRAAAVATLRELTGLPRQPDEVSIEFGVRLDAQAGAVIARTGVEGHLQVSLLWKKSSELAQPGTPDSTTEPAT